MRYIKKNKDANLTDYAMETLFVVGNLGGQSLSLVTTLSP